MRNPTASVLAIFVGIGVAAPRALASTEISSTFSSGIYEGGGTSPGFLNYYIGYSFPSSLSERRNYFIFDLTGVSGPVVSASLKLYLPGPPDLPLGFISSDPTEDYRISGSAFPWTAFAEAFGGTATPPMLSAMFGTMGTGPAYGLTTISAASGGADVIIDLSPEAIMDINAALASDPHFLITGRLPDIHPDMPGMPPSELVFAYTDIPHPLMPFPRLELVTVPAPGAWIPLAGLGAAALAPRGRRRD